MYMKDYTSTYLIGSDSLIVIDKSDFFKSTWWNECVREKGGSFAEFDQCMTFLSNGFEIVVEFEFVVSADYIYDSGDYFTPPSSSLDIIDVDIEINCITIDGYDVELGADVVSMFTKLVDINL